MDKNLSAGGHKEKLKRSLRTRKLEFEKAKIYFIHNYGLDFRTMGRYSDLGRIPSDGGF